MPIIKFNNRYLTFQQAKYFIYAAAGVKLGHLGKKNDVLGQFDPGWELTEVSKSLEANTPDTIVDFLATRKSGGSGKLDFFEPTDAVKIGVKVSGTKVKVVVGKITVISVESGKIKEVLEKEKYRKHIEKNMAVVDGIVVANEFIEMTASEFNAKLKAGFTVAEMVNVRVNASGGTSVLTSAKLSKDTVLGYRLQHVWIDQNGEMRMTRDNPMQAEIK